MVIISAASGHPAPALQGKGLWVTVALGVFSVTLAVALTDRFPERSVELQATVIALMGGAGVAIAGP